ncbi:MAG: 4Fe-4S dicluster domain-containing protein [Phormidesmis sp.]
MTYAITENCISCQRCLPACPTNAIEAKGSTFQINAALCNNCRGFHSVPQCWAACPTNDGCVSLSAGTNVFTLGSALETSKDYWKTWFSAYSHQVARLKESSNSDYWQDWFDAYSQNLQHLKTQAQQNKTAPKNAPLMP